MYRPTGNFIYKPKQSAAANKYAEEADNAVKQINTDIAYYNSMLDGKVEQHYE